MFCNVCQDGGQELEITTLKVLELVTAQLLHARHCSAGFPRRVPVPIMGRRSTWRHWSRRRFSGRFDGSRGGPQCMLHEDDWTVGCRPGQRRMFHGRDAGHGHNGARRCQALSLIIIIIIIIIIITIISIMIIIFIICFISIRVGRVSTMLVGCRWPPL